MSFQAGVAKVNITPAIGCAMAGYAARNTERSVFEMSCGQERFI